MTKDKRASRGLAPNIEAFTKRNRPFRIRFRALGAIHDFGYYEAYDEALIMRNLIAMRLGRDTVEDEIFANVSDATIEALETEYAEALLKAEELGDTVLDLAPKQRGRVTTARLQEQLDQQAAQLAELDRQVKLIRSSI